MFRYFIALIKHLPKTISGANVIKNECSVKNLKNEFSGEKIGIDDGNICKKFIYKLRYSNQF